MFSSFLGRDSSQGSIPRSPRFMDFRFSVLIPVYYKEKPEYFSEALASVINQTLKPNEIVVVKDGPLTDGLEEVLAKYDVENPGLLKIVALDKNKGRGLAAAEGVKNCSYELIARMDSDDISRRDRFEKQIREFQKDPNLDICGSQIAEFEHDIRNVISFRRVPLDDAGIKKYQRKRSAFNHPSVMFKKSSAIKAGNYESSLFMEDAMLYVKMFLSGAKGCNIDDSLVCCRISREMYLRRGGWEYYKNYKSTRKKILDTGYITSLEYYFSLVQHFILAALPNSLRERLYRAVLHR